MTLKLNSHVIDRSEALVQDIPAGHLAFLLARRTSLSDSERPISDCTYGLDRADGAGRGMLCPNSGQQRPLVSPLDRCKIEIGFIDHVMRAGKTPTNANCSSNYHSTLRRLSVRIHFILALARWLSPPRFYLQRDSAEL